MNNWLLQIDVFPIISSVVLYVFFRQLTIRGNGTIALKKCVKKILMPFSECQRVSPLFISISCCCYLVVALYILRRIVGGESSLTFNMLCVSLYMVSISVPMVVDNVLRVLAGGIVEKVVYLTSTVLFIAIFIVGIVNASHAIISLIGA